MTTQQIQCIITLAEEGSFSKAAKKILSTERELENRISNINKLKTGTLTIGTTPFRGSCLLPKSFAAFTRDFPPPYWHSPPLQQLFSHPEPPVHWHCLAHYPARIPSKSSWQKSLLQI